MKPSKVHYKQQDSRPIKQVLDHFKNQLKLNHLRHERVSWSELTKEDFINWPELLPYKSPYEYNERELKIILSQLEKIRFNDQFLQQMRMIANNSMKKVSRKETESNYHRTVKLVVDHFKNQLQINNSNPKKFVWGTIKKEDLLNWPDNLPIKSISKYSLRELRTLLLNLDKIKFSEHYLKKAHQ